MVIFGFIWKWGYCPAFAATGQIYALICKEIGGEGGIRTPGPLTVNGFQDRRIRPLCHLSELAPS